MFLKEGAERRAITYVLSVYGSSLLLFSFLAHKTSDTIHVKGKYI